jgi:Probable lipoprotein LpqN/CHAT domain
MSCDIKLEVGAGSARGEFMARVVDAPSGGEPSAIFQLDVDALLRGRDALENTVLASGAAGRRIVPAHEQQLRQVGQQLFEALFSGHVLGTYRASLGAARQRGEPLRVVLRLTAPHLAALPWEALFDTEIEKFICRREPLVRHVPAPYTREPLEVTPPLRVLGLVASPRGMQPLDVAAEQKQLSEALATPIAGGLIELEWLAHASWDGVHERLLSDQWHVLHFIGHGDYDVDTDQGLIALEGEGGRAEPVEAEQLADLLNEARPTPRLVVLNSCSSGEGGTQDLFSGTAAALVRSGINAVAAMQFTISDSAAIAFAKGFYTAIALGRSVDDATRSGRISMLGRGHSLEWVTPVLYVRGESTQLFRLARPERRGRHHEEPLAQGAPKPIEEQPAQTPPPEPRSTIASAGLRAMYVQARAELRAEHYDAAIGLLDDLLSVASDYHDAAVLREDAVRRRDLADRYQQAIDAQAANDWNTSARLYQQVLELQPDYRDAAIRCEQCEKAQRVIDLQDELRIHADSTNWQAVIDVSDELAALDPEAADPDGLATSARDTLRGEAERERIYTRASAAEDAGDWATAIGHYRSLNGYRDAEIRLHTCEQRQEEAETAKRRPALIGEITALHQAGRWKEVLAAAEELCQLDPDNPDPGGMVSDARAKLREAELADRFAQGVDHLQQAHWKEANRAFTAIEQEQPGYRDAAALLKAAQQKLSETAEVTQRATPPPRPLSQTTTPAPPSPTTPPVPVAVQRRWQTSSWLVAAVSIVVIGVALTILAVVQSSKSSNTSTSTSTATSTATTSAASTSAQASGPNETIADYIKKNNIQETTITQGTPGAPKIDLPVPEGWTRIPEGADAQYFGIVFNTPTNPNDPLKIIATVEKLTGNVDTDKLLAVAPGEVKNLPAYNGGDGIKATLSGFPASRLSGSYTKNGVPQIVAQNTAVIQSKDGTYLLQIKAEGPEADADALRAAAPVIVQKTTITP